MVPLHIAHATLAARDALADENVILIACAASGKSSAVTDQKSRWGIGMRIARALCAIACCFVTQVHAQQISLKPIADARLRYEHVDQAGIADEADALTFRLRAGGQATAGDWSLLVEGEAAVAAIDRYNDGLNGKARYPLVVDPESVDLNRAQLRYAHGAFAATAGRQRIELLDQRFVGSAGFRQNEQTFDALRVQWGKPTGLSADISYVWSVNTVNGSRGTGARQRAIGGDSLFALLGHPTPIGTLTGFAFLVDQDEAVVQGYRLSSQTYGLRLAGSRQLAPAWKLAYAASWARQRDWHRNPNRYRADYALAEASLATGALTATAGNELLGADRGVALTSFQTPLASLIKFQGWADRLTTTPPNGIRDLYGSLGYGWKKTGPADAIGLSAAWHRFDSDRLDQHYGDEWDLLATARRGRATLSARYAHYRAATFATDTDRFWLSLDWLL
jgi:hypothetical protein